MDIEDLKDYIDQMKVIVEDHATYAVSVEAEVDDSRTLTEAGGVERIKGWDAQRKWSDRLAGMRAQVDAAVDQAVEDVRVTDAAITTPKSSTDERSLAEATFSRRREAIVRDLEAQEGQRRIERGVELVASEGHDDALKAIITQEVIDRLETPEAVQEFKHRVSPEYVRASDDLRATERIAAVARHDLAIASARIDAGFRLPEFSVNWVEADAAA